MEENQSTQGLSISDIWPRVLRRRWWILLPMLVCWAAGVGLGFFIPAKYRSETVILIEQQRVPEHYVEPNVAVDLQQRLQSMTEQILSRTRLLGIIDKFQLYPKHRHQLDSEELVDLMRKDITITTIRADGGPEGQISAFKVAYSAGSPVVAQQVTSELTSLFIEENLRNREEMSEDTTAFLENQLQAASKSLNEQEARLRDFKSRYLGELPEQMGANLQILTGLQSRLQAATDSLNHSQQQRLYLQSLLNQYQAMHAPLATDDKNLTTLPPVDLDTKLEALKAQLADLSTKYTPKHPEIIRLRGQIAAIEAQKASAEKQLSLQKRTAQGADQPEMVETSGNSQFAAAIAQLQGQLKANQLEISNDQAAIRKLEQDIDSYQKRLNLTPEREQELAAITRDHEQSLTYYESLLAKRNQSQMATNLEKRQQGEQFRMIDPPSLPQKPYSPNRLLFSLGGLAAGIGLGGAIVILLELLTPRIYGDSELHKLIAAPVLISLPQLPLPKEQIRRKVLLAAESFAAVVLVIVIPTVTFVVYRKG